MTEENARGRGTLAPAGRETPTPEHDTGKLTAKQRRFVDEYLVDLNAAAAARRAGYSARSARKIGYENLTKPDIQAGLREALANLSKRTGVNQERVVDALARVAFHEVDEAEIDVNDVLSALDKLGRYFGIFVDRHDVTSGGMPLEIHVLGRPPE